MLPALAGITGLLAALALATGSLAVVYAAREKAFIAADAAALAAAVASFPPAGASNSPLSAARAAAAANGATLVECTCSVDTSLEVRASTVTTSLTVDVPVFGNVSVRARSRAEFDPGRWLGG